MPDLFSREMLQENCATALLCVKLAERWRELRAEGTDPEKAQNASRAFTVNLDGLWGFVVGRKCTTGWEIERELFLEENPGLATAFPAFDAAVEQALNCWMKAQRNPPFEGWAMLDALKAAAEALERALTHPSEADPYEPWTWFNTHTDISNYMLRNMSKESMRENSKYVRKKGRGKGQVKYSVNDARRNWPDLFKPDA